MKLRSIGVHPKLVAVIDSWLQRRYAHVAVAGKCSEVFEMNNMIYQGTVWGPFLWNCYYADSKNAIRQAGCTEIVYADDLNAFKSFNNKSSNNSIIADMMIC